MERVNEQNPCPRCKKTDWCLYAEDGTACICTRISEGSTKRCAKAGWLHILNKDEFKPIPVKKKRPININWNTLNSCYVKAFNKLHTKLFACSNISMIHLEAGWDGVAFTFPMRNADNQIVGIIRRFADGSKRMLKGGTDGIFLPQGIWDCLPEEWCLFVVEGASDTAVALDMKLRAIGRFNYCTSREPILLHCIKKKPHRVVIVSDSGPDEVKGAKELGIDLAHGYRYFNVACPDIKIITPPTGVKDLRQWRESGLTTSDFLEIVEKDVDLVS